MKTRLLKLIHRVSIIATVIVMTVVFLLALLRAEAPAVASEMPQIMRFLSKTFNHPVQVQSMKLRWHAFWPVLDLQNVNVLGEKPFHIDEIKLGVHFILLKGLVLNIQDNKETSNPLTFSSQSFGYFNHIVLKNALITINQIHMAIPYLNLKKNFHGYWEWKGENFSLNFGKLFLAPIIIDRTSGEFNLKMDSGNWQLQAKNMVAENNDIEATGNLHLSGVPNESPVIDLETQYNINSSLVSRLNDYLPQTVLNPELIRWLTASVKNIGMGDGKFILKGKLSDFPYDTPEKPGEFLIDTQLQDVTLDYFKGWPAAQHLNGDLIFSDSKMQMHITSAELAGIPVEHIEAVIPDLGDASVLGISGNIVTLVMNAQRFIQQSPLQKTVGKKLAGLTWAGPVSIGLNLQIPLGPKAKPSTTQVNGNIDLKNNNLQIAAWKINLKNLTGNVNFTQNGFTSKGLTANFSNSPVKISIDKKGWYHIDYQKWHADLLSASNGGWTANISNPQLAGHFNISPDPMKNGVTGVVDYLNANAADISTTKNTFSPSEIPPLDITIDHFHYKDMKFGRVLLQTTRLPNGLFLHYFQVNSPGYAMTGQGRWMDTNLSEIQGELKSTDLAKTIADWGVPPNITADSATVNFRLNWSGPLYSPDLKNLAGDVDLSIGKGQIITTGSQAKMDFGRLVTLLSFQSLERRLSFDFTDLTQKGLSFDSIVGKLQLNKGIAITKKIKVDGPVAKVEMSGNINLIHQSYQLNVNVTPHLTSSLPIIATIVGTPVAGAAVWAASKVVNPFLNKLTTDHYVVSGSWNNPSIKEE